VSLKEKDANKRHLDRKPKKIQYHGLTIKKDDREEKSGEKGRE
jgi:hypothetical protein